MKFAERKIDILLEEKDWHKYQNATDKELELLLKHHKEDLKEYQAEGEEEDNIAHAKEDIKEIENEIKRRKNQKKMINEGAIYKISLLLEKTENWTKTVTEHEKFHPPAGTFKEKSAEEIAKIISQNWKADYKTTMARLNFFLNRGGKNVSPEIRAKVEKAKEIVKKHYNK